MNYYPLFRVRSWNNGMRCMSLYILTPTHIPLTPVCHLPPDHCTRRCFITLHTPPPHLLSPPLLALCYPHSSLPSTSHPTICDQHTSGGFGRLVTFDLAKSPMLSGRDILCTAAMEYSTYVSKGKTTASVSFFIEIHQILSTYVCGCWRIQSFPRKIVN